MRECSTKFYYAIVFKTFIYRIFELNVRKMYNLSKEVFENIEMKGNLKIIQTFNI